MSEHDEVLAASIYVVLLDDEPLGDLTCKVCFGIHAAHQCPHDE
jgi:hypothetical protein